LPILTRLLPRSLTGRVFGLYSLALLAFVTVGLAAFYRFQFTVQVDQAEEQVQTLVSIIAPAVADAAVIGDYDTIERTLERALQNSWLASAEFIDVSGGRVRADEQARPEVTPPAWLVTLFEERLYDGNLPITVGGRDYGVLRLRFAHERVAGALWLPTRMALWLALGGLVFGLLLIRRPLHNWLDSLERFRSLQHDIRDGTRPVSAGLGADAPLEFRQAFEVLHQAAATLQEQRQQAEVTLCAVADGVVTLDPEGRIVATNPAARDMLQDDKRPLLGAMGHEVLPEIFTPGQRLSPWVQRRFTVERHGRSRVLDATLTGVADQSNGALAGHVLACRDVSEQHLLDQQLRAEIRSREVALKSLRGVLEGLLPHARPLPEDEDNANATLEALSHLISALVGQLQARGDQLDAIFALSPDGFASFDSGGRISLVSRAFSQLTGLDEKRLQGLDEPTLLALLAERAAPESPRPDGERLRRPAGAPGQASRPVLELVRPTRRVLELGLHQGSTGSVSQVLHVRDITHESEVDRIKSEFLSTAAHELRTPMTSIHGFVELMLMREVSTERRRDMLQTVSRQSQLMISIINELLDLARIEARQGKDFHLETLDLLALAQEFAHDAIAPTGREALVLDVQAQAPARVRADRSKLLQALTNVVSNAYKYSRSGEVRLQVIRSDAPRALCLRVSDQGIGMTAEQLARVTERFYRVDASGSVPGTGLGMAIVQEIMQLQDGWLELQSEPEQGTTVSLWLPEDESRAS
jgi:signal transduction histidine kinase